MVTDAISIVTLALVPDCCQDIHIPANGFRNQYLSVRRPSEAAQPGPKFLFWVTLSMGETPGLTLPVLCQVHMLADPAGDAWGG
eukprot:scaffold207139_cov30-Prasinocladus_malaysianus.AAC.1